MLKAIRYLFSQTKRNKNLDILNFIRCAKCKNSNFEIKDFKAVCLSCKENIKFFNK